ncbi:hypothetical protein HD806DRAFT_527221 [Xylariaceae sp. AK1471]|nr:hypothetical protein HD806DRAFT_527221 [Xylariaceae sp. AK1471]
MLEPGAIIGFVGSSVGLIATLIGLVGKSVGVPRSRQHLLEVEEQKRILKRKLRQTEYEIGSLNGIRARGVRHLRHETRNLIRHSHREIANFEGFYNKFIESRTVRGWNYIAISAGSDKICKYAKRFETYSDWITIAQLSISLTLISERASLGDTRMSFLCRINVHHLRDELYRVKRVKEAHPGRLRKLHVNKGVNLRWVERYADGLVLRFDASDTGSASSIVIVDDLREVPAQYRSVSDTRERHHGHGRATQVHPLIDRSSGPTFMHDNQVYDIPPAPRNMYTSATGSKLDTGRSQDDRRYKHSRSRSKTTIMHPELSGSRRSLTTTDSGHNGDDESNTAPISQGGLRPRERHRHSISSDRTYTMTSGLGRSESVASSQHTRRRRQSGSRSNETHTRTSSHQSRPSERDSDQEIRGRHTLKRNFQDIQQNPSSPLRCRPQSSSGHSSRHTDARQEQQRRESVANIEIRPSRSRHSSRSSSANMSSVPSRDSGYGSLDPERYSKGTSVASTRRRSSSRPRPRQHSHSDGGDRSRPPIALDRAEKGIRRAEERIRMNTLGTR